MRLLACVLLVGCEAFRTKGGVDTSAQLPSVVEPSDDSDTDDDTDTDEDTDTDDDTDTDTDTDDPNKLECENPAPQIPNDPSLACVTGFIYDGQTIESNTTGGLSYFDVSHYGPSSSWYCLAIPDGDYYSTERVFMFLHPGEDKYCSVSLETPCADLDLFALRHDVYTFGCPTTQTLGVGCETSVTNGPARDETIANLYENNEQWYMIVVDAKSPQEDWFRLSVSCD